VKTRTYYFASLRAVLGTSSSSLTLLVSSYSNIVIDRKSFAHLKMVIAADGCRFGDIEDSCGIPVGVMNSSLGYIIPIMVYRYR
jgi:hypothetical protein